MGPYRKNKCGSCCAQIHTVVFTSQGKGSQQASIAHLMLGCLVWQQMENCHLLMVSLSKHSICAFLEEQIRDVPFRTPSRSHPCRSIHSAWSIMNGHKSRMKQSRAGEFHRLAGRTEERKMRLWAQCLDCEQQLQRQLPARRVATCVAAGRIHYV